MVNENIVPISESLSKALERLFKAGGFALASGFGGMLLILFSSMADEKLTPRFLLLGVCLLSLVCFFEEKGGDE